MRAAIVEDEKAHADIIMDYLAQYGRQNHLSVSTSVYADGLDIMDDYDGSFDIILLDIQMKHLDGMKTAEAIRKRDKDVLIIFITSTVQYAVQGYTVDALGYILKPFSYAVFARLMDKAVLRMEASRKKNYIAITEKDVRIKLDSSDILYIESRRNNVAIHTRDGVHVTLGPLRHYEELLKEYGFFKCHNAFLVNMAEVYSVKREEIVLTSEDVLPLSRTRKKEFMEHLTKEV